MTKKTIIAMAIAAMCVGTCLARPHGGPGFGGHRPMPMMHHSYHHHGSFWGHGGRNFWPGFVGGVVGSALYGGVYRSYSPTVVYSTSPAFITTTPTVIQPTVVQPIVTSPAPTVSVAPIYSTTQVWVEGRYVDQRQSNGTIVRVWQPGHYEQRSVLVQ